MDAVVGGETFVVTRNGEPVAELRPLRAARHTFITRDEVASLAGAAVRIAVISSVPTSTGRSTSVSRVTSGLLDTSVVIDWHDPEIVAALPDEMAISAITAAELAAGPLLATTSMEAAKRQARLQEVESEVGADSV